MKLARTNIHLRRFRDLCCVSVVVWVRVVPFFNVDPGHEIHVSFQCIAKPNGLANLSIAFPTKHQGSKHPLRFSGKAGAVCNLQYLYIYIL